MQKFIITESQLKLIEEALKIDKIKLPDFILNSIKSHKTSLGDHPCFPIEDETLFEEKILKKRYFELLENVKKVDGVDGNISNGFLIKKLTELLNECKKREINFKDLLEKICFEFTNDIFGVEYGDLNLVCNLTDKIELKQPISPLPTLENHHFENVEHIESLNENILKRRFINSLIQGAATRLSGNFKNVIEKIYEIDPKLPGIYHDIIAINEYLSFVKENKPTKDNVSGTVSVILSDDLLIESEGIIFISLVFESIKGVLELIASHGLPEDVSDAQYVIDKSDFLLAENWDKRLGVGMWDIIINHIEPNHYSLIPNIFQELVTLNSNDFFYVLREILSNTKKGNVLISKMVDSIIKENEFDRISNSGQNNFDDEFFTPDELMNSIGEATSTSSVGDYTYDVPAFLDDETSDHSNLISRSIEDGKKNLKSGSN